MGINKNRKSEPLKRGFTSSKTSYAKYQNGEKRVGMNKKVR